MIDKFNEKTMVKKMIDTGFVDKKNTVYQLITYGTYFKTKGLKEQDIEKEIISFCEKNIKDFNYVKSFDMLGRIVKGIRKREKLKEIGIMSIYKHEIDYINSLDLSLDHKKVIFTFLVLGKIQHDFKDNYYLNNPFSELFKRANVSSGKRYSILSDLNRLGIIRVGERLSIECKFIRDLQSDKNEDCMVVWDFEHIGWSYEQYLFPKKIIVCEGEDCRKIVKKNNNKQKYCKECAKKVKIKMITEMNRARREKEKGLQ